jgi:glycosyltransferase involved in cell wall biosynthesis
MTVDRVVIINDDCTESGGAAAIALCSAISLRQRGFPVTFLSAGSMPDPRLGEIGVEVHCLGGTQLMQGPRVAAAVRGLFDARTAAALSAWIIGNDTPRTCYHLHNWHKALSASIFAPLRRVQARLAITAHDYFLACPNGGYFDYQAQLPCERVPVSTGCIVTNCDRRRYAHKLWRLARHKLRQSIFDLMQSPARVVAVHEGMIPFLEKGSIPRAAIRVLRNPVTTRRSERISVEHNRVMMFVGRLEEDKGVRHLALAARKAALPLWIIGSGPLMPYLKREHPEVRLLGWQPPERISEFLGSARLLIAPSRWRETFGLVALEAVMSGVPVIVSPFALIGGEIVESGFGLACDPHDVDRFADTMHSLAIDTERLRCMSRRAFAGARGMAPTQDQWCDQLINLYRELLGEGMHGRPAASLERPSLSPATALLDGRSMALGQGG